MKGRSGLPVFDRGHGAIVFSFRRCANVTLVVPFHTIIPIRPPSPPLPLLRNPENLSRRSQFDARHGRAFPPSLRKEWSRTRPGPYSHLLEGSVRIARKVLEWLRGSW